MEEKCKGLERWRGGENTSCFYSGPRVHFPACIRRLTTTCNPSSGTLTPFSGHHRLLYSHNTQTYTQAKHKSHTNKYFFKKTNVRNKWIKVCVYVFSNMEMNMVGKQKGTPSPGRESCARPPAYILSACLS